MVPLARLEHATFWSATKRSNPLSYRGNCGGHCNAVWESGQVNFVAAVEQPAPKERCFLCAPSLMMFNLPCLTCLLPHGTMLTARESPSGKASAFQADIRGFESRLPLWRGRQVPGSLEDLAPFRDNGPVAQWLAQATHNRLVAGSNPAGPTFPHQSGPDSNISKQNSVPR